MKAKLIKTEEGFSLYIPHEETNKFIASTDGMHVEYILSLKNCQAIERGYDLDELARNGVKFHEQDEIHRPNSERLYKKGFQKALELMGDKKFSEEDVNGFIDYVIRVKHKREGMGTGLSNKEIINANLGVFRVFEMKDIRKVYWQEYLKSLQQPTEIEVEIKMEPCFYDDSLGGFSTSYTEDKPKEQPKLDSDGCLILKKI